VDTWGDMTTMSEQPDPATRTAEPTGVNLQTDEAKAMVADIKADNAALAEADRTAEAQAEVVVEQAQQLADVVEEVLEELKESAQDLTVAPGER
jgi:hypothetical protein